MSTIDDRGRTIVPVEVRERESLADGTPLVWLDTDEGLLVLTREQALSRIRETTKGIDMVGALIKERRVAAQREDAGCS